MISNPNQVFFEPKPNQSISVVTGQRELTITNMKLQKSVILQKCTKLRFILTIGLHILVPKRLNRLIASDQTTCITVK